MDYYVTAMCYQAAWLGVDSDALGRPGTSLIRSAERDQQQAGHSRAIDVYCLLRGETIIVSYGEAATQWLDDVVSCLETADDAEAARSAMSLALCRPVGHSIKFWYAGGVQRPDRWLAERLVPDDYERYLAFHRQLYPDARQDEWLEEYYRRIAGLGHVCGVTVDGELVSATDAPDIPYMPELIVEPGINTLPSHRRRGYARHAVGTLVDNILAEGKVPVWSCAAANTASYRLARSVGFAELGHAISIAHVG